MIYTIAQLPLSDRYTSEYYAKIVSNDAFEVQKYWREAATVDRSKPYNYFTNLDDAIRYEMAQINWLIAQESVEKVLITDLDFPGLAAAAIPALRLKFPGVKVWGMLHAGSWCNGDIFANDLGKAHQEYSYFSLCEKVFVATEYHANKIRYYFNQELPNLHVLGGFPFDYSLIPDTLLDHKKSKDVLVLGREEQVSDISSMGWLMLPNVQVDFLNGLLPHDEYMKELSEHKVAIIPKIEETFGISALEAIAVGTFPVVPDKFCLR